MKAEEFLEFKSMDIEHSIQNNPSNFTVESLKQTLVDSIKRLEPMRTSEDQTRETIEDILKNFKKKRCIGYDVENGKKIPNVFTYDDTFESSMIKFWLHLFCKQNDTYYHAYNFLTLLFPKIGVQLKSMSDEQLKQAIDNENNGKNNNSADKKKHTYPRLSNKYDADKIFNTFFTGKIAFCSQECFNDWFLEGFFAQPINPVLKGKISRKTRKPAIAYGQIRKFIETITDSKDIKDSYFKKVFNFPKDTNTAKNLDLILLNELKKCEKQKNTKTI